MFSFVDGVVGLRSRFNRLRNIASTYFQGERFRQLIEEHGEDVEVYLVLGRETVGYGVDFTVACEMAESKGILPIECLVLFHPHSIFGF